MSGPIFIFVFFGLFPVWKSWESLVQATYSNLIFSGGEILSTELNIPTAFSMLLPLLLSVPAVLCRQIADPVIVMLTNDGTSLKETYDIWSEQYRQFLHDTHSDSKPLRGVIYHNPKHDPGGLAHRIPGFLKEGIIPDPAPSKRFHLLEATRQAFSAALEKFPEATHYIFVSDSTLPVKPFSYIVGDLSADPRSRFDIFCLEHREGYPKHSQWITLTKKHAELLILDHPAWNKHTAVVSGMCPTLASANDEYWPFRIILDHLRIHKYKEVAAQFRLNEMDTPYGTLGWQTYVDWMLFNVTNSSKTIGTAKEMQGGHPLLFVDLQSRFLREIVGSPNSWFLRKVDGDHMPVINCSQNPLTRLSGALGGNLLPSEKPPQSVVKVPERFGEVSSCALSEFMRVMYIHGPYFPIVTDDPATYYFNSDKAYNDIGAGGYFQAVRMNDNTVVTGESLNELLGGDVYSPGLAHNVRVIRPTITVAAVENLDSD